MREAMRMVIAKVMHQNNLDLLVNPTSTIPPAKIGEAVSHRQQSSGRSLSAQRRSAASRDHRAGRLQLDHL